MATVTVTLRVKVVGESVSEGKVGVVVTMQRGAPLPSVRPKGCDQGPLLCVRVRVCWWYTYTHTHTHTHTYLHTHSQIH